MNSFQRTLARKVLTSVLSRPCDSRIPRSGEKGAAVNCFVTAIDRGEEPYLIVTGIDQDTLSCIEWDGSSYKVERTLSLDEFDLFDFRITHYYGLSEIRYFGILDFLRDRFTAWPYIKIYFVRRLSSADQYLFNKKKLFTKQRKELLKVLVNHALDGRVQHEPLDLMTDLYSIRWFGHPQGNEAHRRLEFYLESLTETGELKKIGYKYIVTGHALRAIEEYEEQERKHTENVKMQRRMIWLTLALAVLAVFQAGLLKFPPFLDLTTKEVAK